MAWLSTIDEAVRSDKKPVGALVHAVQAVSGPVLLFSPQSAPSTLHVVGKVCYHVVADGRDGQASQTTQ